MESLARLVNFSGAVRRAKLFKLEPIYLRDKRRRTRLTDDDGLTFAISSTGDTC